MCALAASASCHSRLVQDQQGRCEQSDSWYTQLTEVLGTVKGLVPVEESVGFGVCPSKIENVEFLAIFISKSPEELY